MKKLLKFLMLNLLLISCSTKPNINKIVGNYIKNNGEISNTKYDISKEKLTENKEIYFANIEGDYWCGTGGCTTILLSKDKENNLKVINEFSPILDIKVSNEIINNWKVLYITVGDGSSKEIKKLIYDIKKGAYIIK